MAFAFTHGQPLMCVRHLLTAVTLEQILISILILSRTIVSIRLLPSHHLQNLSTSHRFDESIYRSSSMERIPEDGSGKAEKRAEKAEADSVSEMPIPIPSNASEGRHAIRQALVNASIAFENATAENFRASEANSKVLQANLEANNAMVKALQADAKAQAAIAAAMQIFSDFL
jgi:hypothetical protein